MPYSNGARDAASCTLGIIALDSNCDSWTFDLRPRFLTIGTGRNPGCVLLTRWRHEYIVCAGSPVSSEI